MSFRRVRPRFGSGLPQAPNRFYDVRAYRDRADLVEALAGAFDMLPEATAADVDRLIEGLLEEGLIHATAAVAPSGFAVEIDGNYVPPRLERHGKLDQLMLSGE